MKRLLEKCIGLRRNIEETNERLAELNSKATSLTIKISDMPRGGERKNGADEYIIQKEELEQRKQYLLSVLNATWNYAARHIESDSVKTLMQYRFYNGYSWKKSAELMGWNENKCFRMYRKVISKKL